MKPNGRLVETLSDFEEKNRKARKVTVGEVEAMTQGMVLAVQEFCAEMLARTDALAAHVGYVPPKNASQEHVDAIMEAQRSGADVE